MTVGEQFGALLTKMGVDATDAKYKDLVTITAAVPDGVDFTSQLFTRKEAEQLLNNDATFQFTQKGKHLGGVDSALKDLLDNFTDLSPAKKEAILNERNTYGKIPLLKDAIAEMVEQAKGATGDDKKALTAKITELNGQILAANESKQTEIKALTDKYEGQFTKAQIKQLLSSFEYPDGTGLSKDDYLLLAENKINQNLAAKKATYVRNGEDIILKQQDNPELEYFENNKAVSFPDFVKSTLTEAKLLKVNGGGAKPAANTPSAANPTDTRAQQLNAKQQILQEALGNRNVAQFAEVAGAAS